MPENYYSSLKSLLNVLTDPGTVFEKVIGKSEFASPALILCGFNALLAVILLPKIRAAALWMAEHSTVAISPSAKALIPVTATIAAFVGAVLAPLLIWLVVAQVLKFYGDLHKSGQSLGTFFTVAVYGYVPMAIGALIAAGIALATPVENFKRVTVSLAMFMPYTKSFTYAFSTRLNPFTWWSIALWSTGGGKALKKAPFGLAIYLFGLWLIYSLVSTYFVYSQLT